MKNINYKVFFKGWNKEEPLDLVLTFKKINFKKKVKIPFRIISDLKNLSDKNPIIVVFQNIEDVLTIGDYPNTNDYINYYVILYSSKLDGKKEGLLIGSEKKESDLVILGLWPFNSFKDDFSKEQILEIFNCLINMTNNYESISLISS
ncbi:MAG: hypothetical protein ACFFBP_09890 [Promethearchaeota archaeon]